jgi:Tol biopolymer transport system component
MIREFASVALFCISAMPHTPQRVVPPPAAMVVDGVPSLSESPTMKRKVETYSASGEASLMDWSRGDRTMLIKTVSTKTNSRQIYDLKAPMGTPRQRTAFNSETTASIWQPGNPGTLVIAKDDDGNELRQVYRLDPKKGTTNLLSDGKSTNSYPVWSPRGDLVAFCAIHRTEKSTGICTVDPNHPASLKEIAQLTGANWDDVTDWSPDGKNLLVVSGDVSVGTRMFLVNAVTGEKTDVTPSEKTAIFMPVGFTADSRGILVATNLDSEFR